MRYSPLRSRLGLTAAFAASVLAAPSLAHATQLIANGGFESNGGIGSQTFANWTEDNQAGGNGGLFVQSGTGSPQNGFGVAAPPEGSFAAMTDQGGPGSHVLFQSFVVPTGVTSATLGFQLFLHNQASTFITNPSLDFGAGSNQQFRADILSAAASPFSTAAGDVLQTVYQTQPGHPANSGYSQVTADLTTLLAADAGQTLVLRLAETDNQGFFATGVDSVSLAVNMAVPEPATLALLGSGLFGLGLLRRRGGGATG